MTIAEFIHSQPEERLAPKRRRQNLPGASVLLFDNKLDVIAMAPR
jgi:hypothetical protein